MATTRTTRSKTLKRALAALSVAAALATPALALTPTASADPASCETISWGFLGSQRRTVCDSPINADGNWNRHRVFWIPAHHVPLTTSCYGGRYWTQCQTYGGYDVPTRIVGDETYLVTPDTVLPDEPGHLPAWAAVVAR